MIRSVTKAAIQQYGFEVFGIEDGYEGLIFKRGHFLSWNDVSGILAQGGTILGTSNTADPFRAAVPKGRKKIIFEDQSESAVQTFRDWKLDALIAVGGDGTLRIAQKLFEKGIPVVGIPKTIDNDLWGTDYTFGFDTAVQIATEAIDRLHTTAASHHRIMLLEVMGRHAGWIAVYAGAAGGADIILIPEIPFIMKKVCLEVNERAQKGRRFSLVVIAEGAHAKGDPPFSHEDKKNPYPLKLGGIANVLARTVEEQTGLETRAAVLGHIQRGGTPSPFDRNLGTLFGHHAVELVHAKKWGEMVCLVGQKIKSLPLRKAVGISKKVPLNHPLILSAKALGASFGI